MTAGIQENAVKSEILAHFEELAPEYDGYKERNSFYYGGLKELLRQSIPPDAGQIAEIGCGTGDLLASLEPVEGLGLDLSPAMIELCRTKHRSASLRFAVGDAENLPDLSGYETVFLTDVIEHLSDLPEAFRSLGGAMRPDALLILTWANHLWTPILDLAERFRLKMPEGPHLWVSPPRVIELLAEHGFRVERHETHMLCPLALGGLGRLINRTVGRLPLLRRLGVIRIVVARRCV